MIDALSIALAHTLLGVAAWRLSNRPELDNEPPPTPDVRPDGFAPRVLHHISLEPKFGKAAKKQRLKVQKKYTAKRRPPRA